jgi:hypothetical protein
MGGIFNTALRRYCSTLFQNFYKSVYRIRVLHISNLQIYTKVSGHNYTLFNQTNELT